MADGKTHERYNINYLGIITIVSIILIIVDILLNLNFPIMNIVALFLGGLGGLAMTPDLDLISIEQTRFGRLSFIIFRSILLSDIISKIHQILCAPYIVAIPHRSILSHSLFLSTAIRILYLLCILYFPYYFFISAININMYFAMIYNIILTYPAFFGIMFLSWSIQDAIHLWLDGIFIYPRKKYKTIKKGIMK